MSEISKLSKYITKPSFIKIKLLDGRSIGIRTWKMGEEKDFLFSVESRKSNNEDEDVIIEECVKLAKKCVDKPKIVDTLSEANLVYLLAELRKLSKGQLVPLNYYCMNPECDDYMTFNEAQQKEFEMKGRGRTLLEDTVDIVSEEDVVISRFDSTPIKIGDFKYYIQEVPYKDRKKLSDKYIKTMELSRWNYNFVLSSIKAIEPTGEKKITNISPPDLVEFIDNQLDKNQFKELSDTISEKISKFTIDKHVKCPLCESEDPVIYDEIISLMVF